MPVLATTLSPALAHYETLLVPAAEHALKLLGKAHLTLELFIVGNDTMQKNVLSFPAQNDFPRPDLPAPALGEVHLNPSYIEEHDEDLLLMLVHGILHCLAYDHEDEHDRINMEAKEQELLSQIRSSERIMQ